MTLDNATLDQWATWREIHAQPQIWRDWLSGLDVAAWRDWIEAQNVEEVWFCGAGTSAFIGDIIATGLPRVGKLRFRSVPTTDLVADPKTLIGATDRALVVSFGRSGNSTESVGTLDVLDALAPDWPRLNITCNAAGVLATRTAASAPSRAILLPEACHDAGFAMTSSFSTMLLTALALFDPSFDAKPQAVTLADQAAAVLADAAMPSTIGASDAVPARAIYVGSGALTYAARECALKVMELTAGQMPALWDSSLGFRHGPKSFVVDGTAIHVLLSADPHTAQYDHDLVAELRSQFPKARVLSIGPGGDLNIPWSHGPEAAAPAVLPAQMQGVFWAAALGLNVDDPFTGRGTLTRVVDGVKLHQVEV